MEAVVLSSFLIVSAVCALAGAVVVLWNFIRQRKGR